MKKRWWLLPAVIVVVGSLMVPLLLISTVMVAFTGAQQATSASNASGCTASWQGDSLTETDLTDAQLNIAATIYQVAGEVGVGDPGAVVAIATALQESTLGANPAAQVPNSDGDVGIFQQRALVGWYADGTTLQANTTILLDPAYAARTFFTGHDTADGYHIPGLVDIPNWQRLTVAQAAQAVQVSAFPDAYAQHEALARSLTARLAGGALGQVLCSGSVGGSLDCPPTGLASETGLTPDALRGLRCVKQHWPQITSIGGIRVDPGSDHNDGNAIDVMIDDYTTPAGIALGDEIAAWAQNEAAGLGVSYIIWRRQIFNVTRADEGWRTCGAEATCYSGDDPSAAHLDHVHLSFYGNAGTGHTATSTTVGMVVLPVTPGSYRLTARYNQAGSAWSSGFHTGLDFAAPTGTPLYAITDATVTSTLWHASYGNLTILTADDGTVFYYAHQSSRSVTEGQRVTAGQKLGAVGETGNAFGAHLHLEVRVGGQRTDPEVWFAHHGATP